LAPGAKVTHQGANRVIRIAEPLRDVAKGAVVDKEGPQRFVLAVEGLRGFVKEALTRRIIHGWASSVRVDSGWALGLIVGRWRAASKGRGRADPSRTLELGLEMRRNKGVAAQEAPPITRKAGLLSDQKGPSRASNGTGKNAGSSSRMRVHFPTMEIRD
jgi:hypothetical protein